MITLIDPAKARADTPGCKNVLHFNNAGAALMPQIVLDAVIEHLELEIAIGGYEAAAKADEKIEHTYDAV
ncbi:MAG: aminotransferase, partial [Gammaproteobacteria bacterium]